MPIIKWLDNETDSLFAAYNKRKSRKFFLMSI